jgi:hypothetical protein
VKTGGEPNPVVDPKVIRDELCHELGAKDWEDYSRKVQGFVHSRSWEYLQDKIDKMTRDWNRRFREAKRRAGGPIPELARKSPGNEDCDLIRDAFLKALSQWAEGRNPYDEWDTERFEKLLKKAAQDVAPDKSWAELLDEARSGPPGEWTKFVGELKTVLVAPIEALDRSFFAISPKKFRAIYSGAWDRVEKEHRAGVKDPIKNLKNYLEASSKALGFASWQDLQDKAKKAMGRSAYADMFRKISRESQLRARRLREGTVPVPKEGTEGNYYKGQVIDGDTRKPIAAVEVKVRTDKGEQFDITDKEGNFSIDRLEGSEILGFELKAKEKEYVGGRISKRDRERPRRERFSWKLNTERNVFQLRKLGELVLQVRLPEGAKTPLRIKTLVIDEEDRSRAGHMGMDYTVEEEDGVNIVQDFFAKVIPAVSLYIPGWAPVVVENVKIKPGESTKVLLQPTKKGGTVKGTVKDTDGKPLESIWVQANLPNAPYIACRTKADGRFAIPDVPEGYVDVKFSKNGYVPIGIGFRFRGGDKDRGLDVELVPSGELKGTAKTHTGKFLSGWIMAKRIDDRGLRETKVGRGGSFYFGDIEPGEYRILYKGRYVLETQVKRGETTEIEAVLPRDKDRKPKAPPETISFKSDAVVIDGRSLPLPGRLGDFEKVLGEADKVHHYGETIHVWHSMGLVLWCKEGSDGPDDKAVGFGISFEKESEDLYAKKKFHGMVLVDGQPVTAGMSVRLLADMGFNTHLEKKLGTALISVFANKEGMVNGVRIAKSGK